MKRIPMIVHQSVSDDFDLEWSRLAPGEILLTAFPVDGNLGKLFFQLPEEFPEEDFIASVTDGH